MQKNEQISHAYFCGTKETTSPTCEHNVKCICMQRRKLNTIISIQIWSITIKFSMMKRRERKKERGIDLQTFLMVSSLRCHMDLWVIRSLWPSTCSTRTAIKGQSGSAFTLHREALLLLLLSVYYNSKN